MAATRLRKIEKLKNKNAKRKGTRGPPCALQKFFLSIQKDSYEAELRTVVARELFSNVQSEEL